MMQRECEPAFPKLHFLLDCRRRLRHNRRTRVTSLGRDRQDPWREAMPVAINFAFNELENLLSDAVHAPEFGGPAARRRSSRARAAGVEGWVRQANHPSRGGHQPGGDRGRGRADQAGYSNVKDVLEPFEPPSPFRLPSRSGPTWIKKSWLKHICSSARKETWRRTRRFSRAMCQHCLCLWRKPPCAEPAQAEERGTRTIPMPPSRRCAFQ